MYNLKKIRAAWAEVDLDALAHNMREVRRLAHKDALVTAVIKADGYGHGAKKIAQTLLDSGADRFAVAVLDEGIELRYSGFKVPILILGFTDKERAEEIVRNDLEQTVYSWDLAEALSLEAGKLGRTARIHIKIDTGMGRIGLQPDRDSVQLIKKISQLPNIIIEGIFTHFAVADSSDKTYTRIQYGRFNSILDELEKEGVEINLRHCGNSAAIIDLQDMHMDMVRAGIMIYGLKPSDEVMLGKLELKQVMSLKVRISHIKDIEAGQSVSYGRRFIAGEKRRIASLPIGYADGYTRMLTGKGEVLVNGVRVPLVGSICMDQCMIDVTGIEDVKVGDEAVLFGKQGDGFIHVDELAEKLGTINYEITCMINKRVPRVYIRNGEIVDIQNYIIG